MPRTAEQNKNKLFSYTLVFQCTSNDVRASRRPVADMVNPTKEGLEVRRILSALVLGALTYGTASAQSFLTVRVESEETAVVCIGDEANQSRYGGAEVIEGEAKVLLPLPLAQKRGAGEFLVTAANSSGAVIERLDLSEKAESMFLEIGSDKPGNCVADRLVALGKVPEAFGQFYETYQNRILEYVDDEDLSPRAIDTYVLSGIEMLEANISNSGKLKVIPNAGLQTVFDSIAEEQKRREDREKLEKFLESLGPALEEAARQNQEKRERLKAEKEAAEQERLDAEKAEAEANSKHYCFGGVGQNCDGFYVDPFPSWLDGDKIEAGGSTCTRDGNGYSCWVNSGSWLHDECCANNPNGVMCGGNESSNACQNAWDRAWRRTSSPLSWDSKFSGRGQSQTTVNFRAHCAASNQLIEMPEDNPRDNDYGFDDRQLCCSGNHRGLHWWEYGVYAVMPLIFYFEPVEACK